MTERIGRSLLAREALLAAMEARQREAAAAASRGPGEGGFPSALEKAGPGAESASSPGAARGADKVETILDAVEGGLHDVDRSVQRAEALDEAMVLGKVQDFHEVAVQVKQADLSFRFALEVRNRLIDAYREVMRMNV